MFIFEIFGPDEEDHLFTFTLEEIADFVVPQNARLIKSGYLGSTILINKYSHPLIRLVPLRMLEFFIRICTKVPIINRKTVENVFAILQKI